MVDCLVFLREPGVVERKEGLGSHKFARVPVVGEYVTLDTEGPHLRITHVHHTGFGDHKAELYAVEAKELQTIGGDPHPPASPVEYDKMERSTGFY